MTGVQTCALPILFEIMENINERVFLFVDHVSSHVNDLKYLVTNANKRGGKLTIIVAERTNEWNIECEELNSYEIGRASCRERV